MAPREVEIDLYSPPAREADADLTVPGEAEDAVINALYRGRAPAIALGALGMMAGLFFGICAMSLMSRESSIGGALYFLGLAAGCAGPSWLLFRKARELQDLMALRTNEKAIRVIETNNLFVRVAAIVVVLVVGVSVLVFLSFLGGGGWD